MSIFRNTFTSEVSSSLNARQQAVQRRNPTDIIYQNSRNAWIRMTSGVDVNGDGGALARQYIMLGGVLNTDKSLRAGVGGLSNAYSTTSPSGNPYNTDAKAGTAGYKPMPGITSVDVKSKTAYGSLREVTVNFSCNNLQQLEDLELLYMRPGYTALVEWGWTPYLNDKGQIQNNISFYDGVLNGGIEREQIFLDLFQKSKDNYGNYEAHYGYVKNYNWTARMDGGYDCSTTIISVGEILESLKANWVALDTSNILNQRGLLADPTSLYNVTKNINAAISGSANDIPLKEAYSKNVLAGLCYEMYTKCSKKFKDNRSQPIAFSSFSPDKKVTYDLYVLDLPLQNLSPTIFDLTTTSNIQGYITLESFINLLNERVVLHYADKDGKKTQAFVKLSTKQNKYDISKTDKTENPDNNLLCLSHPLQVSIDPTVCLISSPIWSNGIDVNGKTVQVEYLKEFDRQANPFRFKKDWNTELGNIGNIYVNISKLYELAITDQGDGPELKIYPYLKKLLSEIQEAIGGVNSFEIHTDPIDNVSRIIDLNYVDYVDPKTSYANAFQIEMANTSSLVRSYTLQSLIFPNQSNLIALGAQLDGSGNQASQNSTLLDFNEGLQDRIMPKKVAAPTYVNFVTGSESTVLQNSFNILADIFTPIDPKSAPIQQKGNPVTKPTYSYKSALRDIIVYFQGRTKSKTKNKAIIPVKTSLTIDGIGGLIIGHLFKIPPDLLPKGYRISTTGYKLLQIVTGINHKIENGDWTTTIDAQQIITGEPKGDVDFKDLIKISSTGVASVAGVSNSYKDKTEFDYTPTKVTRQEVVDYLKYRNDFDINVRRSVLAIFQIESGNGTSGINNNYYGIQTDVGRWTYGGQYFSGTTTVVDSGGANRRFATFVDYKTATYFMLETIKSRNITGVTADKWAESYVYNWLSPSDKAGTYQNRRKELSLIYNNAIKDLPS